MKQRNTSKPNRKPAKRWVFISLLILVLIMGAYLRTRGIFWGEYQYLHPDERFLVWVGTDISPVESLSDYWNTATSSLNPHNRGHDFYVYGTLPMFLTRYLVEWIYGHSGFQEMTNVGRALSATSDILTILLVYLIGKHVYGRRVGVLAAAFSAMAVLQIQLSHYFTMDSFTTFFSSLAVYFAVKIAMDPKEDFLRNPISNEHLNVSTVESDDTPPNNEYIESNVQLTMEPTTTQNWTNTIVRVISNRFFILSLGFGIALGMAVASKINAAPLAFLLPGALMIRLYSLPTTDKREGSLNAIGYLFLAAIVSLLVFRILQPYAFQGPGFFGVLPNQAWFDDLRELQTLTGGDADFPPAMQWARRPVWFSGQNLVLWGLGLPLGLSAWAGFLWIGWRMVKGEWKRHILLWLWTAFYFTWQSLVGNPSMRYQLLIYPLLAIYAAWIIVHLYELRSEQGSEKRQTLWPKFAALFLGGMVLLTTAAYSFGFSSIYTRQITRLEASRWIYQNIPGAINIRINTDAGLYNQPLPYPSNFTITQDFPFVSNFNPKESGWMDSILLGNVVRQSDSPESIYLTISISDNTDFENPLTQGQLLIDTQTESGPTEVGYLVVLDQPINLEQGKDYYYEITLQSGTDGIVLEGTKIANEGAWDDPVPYRVDGYDGFGGIYQGLNFDMYDDDNPLKLERFLSILDQAEYLLISSSRQWGSLPRIPERFPMTAEYYRQLIGCPPEQTVEWCYNVAKPSMFTGNLGFDLVQTFQSDPAIAGLSINDQFSEEAFTVYDHPKVFIFKKQAQYDSQHVHDVLEAVDLSKVVHITPKQAGSLPKDAMLPLDRLVEQRTGGTWSEIFNIEAFYNRWPIVGAILWYCLIALLGLFTYPLVRFVLSGLEDHGYPFARTAGLLVSSYFVWLAGSLGIHASRLTITIVLLLIAIGGFILAFAQRDSLRNELRKRWKYYVLVEGLFLLFFLVDLLIRYGNPDLWHPWKGGEKPMDFSYFNAVLKSETFPPYDPWFSGGYINYYYYGFLFVGVLVKWLGIVPSIAYNFIIPTVFSLIALGAFSIGWNLLARNNLRDKGSIGRFVPLYSGLAATLSVAVLGNLGTIRMIYQGFQKLGAPGGAIEEGVNIISRFIWAGKGFIQTIVGASLPYSIADWYWIPSRVISAPGEVEPITEFPFFTVLYADPHAHLFALPIALLGLGWAISVVIGKFWDVNPTSSRGSLIRVAIGLLFGGLVYGALRPTNTWDMPTYLAIGAVALGYAAWRYIKLKDGSSQEQDGSNVGIKRFLFSIASIGFLVGFAFLLYKPYADWYVLPYSSISMWEGTHTSTLDYLTHWGLFLFVIVSWMIWETFDWMQSTPVSSLIKLKPYKSTILMVLAFIIVLVTVLLMLEVIIAWLVLPLAAWTAILIFRPGLSDSKRIVLFLTGTALVLTLMVEVVVLDGDIGRMNTVFKFYLQAWTILAICTAVSFGWLVSAVSKWSYGWRTAWQFGIVVLVASGALYPVMASMAKIKDRMTPDAPHTLDGMTYMAYSKYDDLNTNMDLSQDYDAIRWMQDNVIGSPVIVEGNMVEYHWGNRFTIYTGLPNVVGWNWHQRQQRAASPGGTVENRVSDVENFYITTDIIQAESFIDRYDVSYIIVGQLERALYSSPGLDKFEAMEGILWQEVYRNGETVIYQVLSV